MKRKILRPVDIIYPERTPLSGGAIFATLPTLGALDRFWKKNRERLPFAATSGAMIGGPEFLNEYEWVFAPTIPVLVKTVARWDEIGIKVEWYDWASENPRGHEFFFTERDAYRSHSIASGTWSAADQEEYSHDSSIRTPDTYRGWWRLANLPGGEDNDDWLDPFVEEIIDKDLLPEKVAELLQIQIFDSWKRSGVMNVQFHDQISLSEYISYWHEERVSSNDYYGQENEVAVQS